MLITHQAMLKIHSTQVHLHRGIQEAGSRCSLGGAGGGGVRAGGNQQSLRLQDVDPTPANKEAVKPQRPENGNSSDLELTPPPLQRPTI